MFINNYKNDIEGETFFLFFFLTASLLVYLWKTFICQIKVLWNDQQKSCKKKHKIWNDIIESTLTEPHNYMTRSKNALKYKIILPFVFNSGWIKYFASPKRVIIFMN